MKKLTDTYTHIHTLAIIAIPLMFYALVGCQQKQDSVQDQPSKQKTESEQIQQQRGAENTNANNLQTNPHGLGTYSAQGYVDETPPDMCADGQGYEVDRVDTDGDGAPDTPIGRGLQPLRQPGEAENVSSILHKSKRAATDNTFIYIAGNVSNEQTLTTGNNSGAMDAATSPLQTPTQTSTGGPMHLTPEVSFAVPIVMAWAGGAATGGPTATASGQGTTGSQTASQTASGMAQWLKASNPAAWEELKKLVWAERPPTTPTTPTDPTTPVIP